MWAASLGHADVCETLVRHGATDEPADRDGNTALLLAADRGRHDGEHPTTSPLPLSVCC